MESIHLDDVQSLQSVLIELIDIGAWIVRTLLYMF